jgi:hypothetical protein
VKHKVGILISGRGSNMMSLVEASRAENSPYEIALVASDKPDAPGLAWARDNGVATFAHSPKGIPKPEYEAAIDAALREAGVETIALAGYMRLLSDDFVAKWRGRILNIHPSLLPKYPGLHTHARALAAGDTRHAEFDWKAGEVRVSEGGHDYRYPTTPGLVDRQTVTLALAADLAHGRKTFEYAVAVKDRVERRRYEHGPRESLVVPAGTFEGLLMRRTDDVGPGRSRIARSWFAPAHGWLPVQIEQVETKKDEVISLKLVEAPAPAAGSSRAGLAPRPSPLVPSP